MVLWFLASWFFALDLGGVELANVFELNAEAVTQGALIPQLIEQGLGLVKGVGGNVFAFEQVAEAALNLRFSKQGETPGAALRNSRGEAGCLTLRFY